MIKTIYLAGGCFCGLQKLMKEINGVVHTASGYANGTDEADASYSKVCSGRTGFSETVRVDYDPSEVTLDKLLFAFFYVIDLEAVNRSFGMVRTEVRSRTGNSHLGHVFQGEAESPSGVRYCINSTALRFIPYDKMEEEGYGMLMERV